ncbi:MAG: hypothetical protein ACKODY_05360 [Actinomycetota bacterium]
MIFSAISAVLVFLIAALVVGREARRLDAVAPRAVYEIEQALSFVSDALPEITQARLTPDELAELLRLHLVWLHERGLQPDRVVDRKQDIEQPVVVSEDALSAHLLGAAEAAGVELLDDVDIVNVVDAHLAYFEAIGAVGPPADEV